LVGRRAGALAGVLFIPDRLPCDHRRYGLSGSLALRRITRLAEPVADAVEGFDHLEVVVDQP
jgi:hypothetical protein